jgi:hypothetical protein
MTMEASREMEGVLFRGDGEDRGGWQEYLKVCVAVSRK